MSLSKCAEGRLYVTKFICRSFSFNARDNVCNMFDNVVGDETRRNEGDDSINTHFEMISFFRKRNNLVSPHAVSLKIDTQCVLDCSGSTSGTPLCLDDPKGKLASPGWPMPFSAQNECFWEVMPYPGRRVWLKFTHYYLFGSCHKQALTIDQQNSCKMDGNITRKYFVYRKVLAHENLVIKLFS